VARKCVDALAANYGIPRRSWVPFPLVDPPTALGKTSMVASGAAVTRDRAVDDILSMKP
jgi:hypothetical protein